MKAFVIGLILIHQLITSRINAHTASTESPPTLGNTSPTIAESTASPPTLGNTSPTIAESTASPPTLGNTSPTIAESTASPPTLGNTSPTIAESTANPQTLGNTSPTIAESTENPPTLGNVLPTLFIEHTTASPDFVGPTVAIDVTTTTTNKPTTANNIPDIVPFEFFLQASCCDLRRCPSTMGCEDYEGRWGCKCTMSEIQKIQRQRQAHAIMLRMGLIRESEPDHGHEH